MTVRTVIATASLALGLVTSGCLSMYEIGIETPIQSKLDVAQFQRVLVAGFVAGGTNDVDANAETVRLVRSQLRTKSDLKVIDADTVALVDVVDKLHPATPTPAAAAPAAAPAAPVNDTAQPAPANGVATAADKDVKIKSAKDLAPYEQIFADVDYWKKLGEEYQGPLIVTGSILFDPIQRSGIVSHPQTYIDPTGRQQVQDERSYMDRRGFELVPKFVFIDGRTGVQLYSETFHEETLYDASQNTPPLSSYFELMDRVMPGFLNTLSTQKIRGTRTLIK